MQALGQEVPEDMDAEYFWPSPSSSSQVTNLYKFKLLKQEAQKSVFLRQRSLYVWYFSVVEGN